MSDLSARQLLENSVNHLHEKELSLYRPNFHFDNSPPASARLPLSARPPLSARDGGDSESFPATHVNAQLSNFSLPSIIDYTEEEESEPLPPLAQLSFPAHNNSEQPAPVPSFTFPIHTNATNTHATTDELTLLREQNKALQAQIQQLQGENVTQRNSIVKLQSELSSAKLESAEAKAGASAAIAQLSLSKGNSSDGTSTTDSATAVQQAVDAAVASYAEQVAQLSNGVLALQKALQSKEQLFTLKLKEQELGYNTALQSLHSQLTQSQDRYAQLYNALTVLSDPTLQPTAELSAAVACSYAFNLPDPALHIDRQSERFKQLYVLYTSLQQTIRRQERELVQLRRLKQHHTQCEYGVSQQSAYNPAVNGGPQQQTLPVTHDLYSTILHKTENNKNMRLRIIHLGE